MTNNLIKDNIQLDSTKLTRDGADGYSSALFELHLQLHSQVVNPYTFNPKQNYNSYSTLKESYNYDGVYGPIPDENGFVDLTDYASLYIPNYSTVTSIPEENQKYLDSGILPTNMTRTFFGMNECKIIDISKIDTSNVISLENAFSCTDKNSKILYDIIGLDKINTSNVINMAYMFSNVKISIEILNKLSNLNVSNVENLDNFIGTAGTEAFTAPYTLDLSNWDVRKLKSYNSFASVIDNDFYGTKYFIMDLSNWNLESMPIDNVRQIIGNPDPALDTSKNDEEILNTNSLLYPTLLNSSYGCAGYKLILKNWKLPKGIKQLRGMFAQFADDYSKLPVIVDVTGWQNTDTLEDISYMFARPDSDGFDSGACVSEIIGLDTWDTSNLVNMNYFACYTRCNKYNICNWNLNRCRYFIEPFVSSDTDSEGYDIPFYFKLITNMPLDFINVIDTGENNFIYAPATDSLYDKYLSDDCPEIHIKNFPRILLNKIQNEYGRKINTDKIIIDNYID